MNVGVLGEKDRHDHRVALTPQVARQLAARGHAIWVEAGAGERAMFRDDEYIAAGADIAYSAADVIRRSELVVKIAGPTPEEIAACAKGTALLAFYHMTAAEAQMFQRLTEREVTAIGCEIIETYAGGLPVLAAVSEIAGQMTVPLASHLLRSSSGGRGILLGGSPGIPPARVAILGAGVVGSCAARAAAAAGASVLVLDINVEKLRAIAQHVPHVATAFADPDSVRKAAAAADVVIGAVLVAGSRAPHVVTKAMVEQMKPGAVIIDVAIDQGGCVETSRPTTIAAPTFLAHGVTHYCVPNLTADIGRSTSLAIAQAVMPYLLCLAEYGVAGAMRRSPELARGVYLYRGVCTHPALAAARQAVCRPLADLLHDEGTAA